MINDWQNGGFGIYLHWPFCESKCPYCDFNSHVAQEIDQEAWLQAYLKCLDEAAIKTSSRLLNTVFFGGGTPSLMSPKLVSEIMNRIKCLWNVSNDLEVTLEANPSSFEANKFKEYYDAGINRLSVGVQALNDKDLKRLGRLHSVSEAINAVEISNSIFNHTSLDLIYARQDQTIDDWSAELIRALEPKTSHLSLYQLTIEDGTPFGNLSKKGKLKGLPVDDQAANLYEVTQDICNKFNLPAYEISNHSKPGSESRHNLVYWRYGDYLGIGPGAHGRITIDGKKLATLGKHDPREWLSAVKNSKNYETIAPISSIDQAKEYLVMGLRISEGISLSRVKKICDHKINENNIGYLTDLGLVTVDDDRLSVNSSGRIVLNQIINKLSDTFY